VLSEIYMINQTLTAVLLALFGRGPIGVEK